jgi:O-antigen ligase
MAVLSVPSEYLQPLMIRFQGLIGWSALGCVLLSSLALGGDRPLVWTLLALIVLGLFCAQVALDLLDRPSSSSLQIMGPAALFLAALLWALLQIWPGALAPWADPAWREVAGAAPRISVDPVNGAHALMRLATYGMIFWILLRSAEKSDRAHAMLVTVALFSTALAAFGLATMLAGIAPPGGGSGGRVSASFGTPGTFATFAIFGIVTNLGLYLHRIPFTEDDDDIPLSMWLRDVLEAFFDKGWIFALGLFLCLAALMFTDSRAGLVSGAVAILALLATTVKSRRLRTRLAMAGLAVIVTLTGIFMVLAPKDAPGPTPLDDRLQVYGQIVGAIAERPLAGYGIGSFDDSFRRSIPAEQAGTEWTHASNAYLETFFELGLIGALPFYLALAWILAVLIRGAATRRRNRVFSCVAIGIFAGAAVHAGTDIGLQVPATAGLLAVVLAIGWSQSFGSRHRRSPP